jgi:hypothetical protein
MDPLMPRRTWTTAMAIDLCDGRKCILGPLICVMAGSVFWSLSLLVTGNNQQV